MIYARLLGGLGNQLFQYAAGRALALRLGVELVLDMRAAGRAPAHFRPALHHFGIEYRDDVDLPPDKTRPLAYAIWRYGGGRPKFYRERGLGFNQAVFQAPDDTYLHGYFQSERYFSDQIDAIRKDLRIVTPPGPANAAALEEIGAAGMPVSLHVRRGDYVNDAKGARMHGTCDASYYRAALDLLDARLGTELSVFVFSDDPDWARENLALGRPVRVFDHNGPERHYEDLRLMAACRHNVIANSTFSWWGGWMNPSPDKIVVAPRRWFADPSASNPDILPASWVAIEGA
jgi:hypothetical protein